MIKKNLKSYLELIPCGPKVQEVEMAVIKGTVIIKSDTELTIHSV